MTSLTLPEYNAFEDYQKGWTSNFADHNLCKPHICCGWMDLHTDDIFGSKIKRWTIKVIWIHSQAVFIHRDKHYKIEYLKSGDTITFNPTKMHGLVPQSIGEEIAFSDTCKFAAYRKFRKQIIYAAMKPKLIFDFVGLYNE